MKISNSNTPKIIKDHPVIKIVPPQPLTDMNKPITQNKKKKS
jgi:hypothetical protein